MAILALLLAAGIAIGGIFVLAQERLAGHREPMTTQRLAACLEDHMVAELSVEGEALIEHACRERGRDVAQAQCILSHTDELSDPARAKAIARGCKVEAPVD